MYSGYQQLQPVMASQNDELPRAIPMANRAPMGVPTKQKQKQRRPALQDVKPAALNLPNKKMQPPSQYPSLKPSTTPLAPMNHSQGNRLNQFTAPPAIHAPYTDSMPKKQPSIQKHQAPALKALANPSAQYVDQENLYPRIQPASTNPMPTSGTFIQQKPSAKRAAPGPVDIEATRPNKKPKGQAQQRPSSAGQSSAPEDKEAVPLKITNIEIDAKFRNWVDDGEKSILSYAQWCALAIMAAPDQRASLAEIYQYITDKCSYIRNLHDKKGWQNSIRHNLSLSDNFQKVDRPVDRPGKGMLWTLHDECVVIFKPEKASKKNTGVKAENASTMHLESVEPLQPAPQFLQEPSVPPQVSQSAELHQGLPNIPAPHPSSDATIPESDFNLPDDNFSSLTFEPGIVYDQGFFPDVSSSPPVSKEREERELHSATPTRAVKVRVSSGPRSRQHNRRPMADSGYQSGLSSSVMRGHYKDGSAEEELARMRSSSPLRRMNSMPPPSTPAFKPKPQKPPPSMSPNTCLDLHRENIAKMHASPLRKMLYAANFPQQSPSQSPGFMFLGPASELNFQIHTDSPGLGSPLTGTLSIDRNGSPIKRPFGNKRPRPERVQSTPVLGDITNSAYYKHINFNFTPLPHSTTSYSYESPSKFFDFAASPTKMPINEHVKNIENMNFSGFDLENLENMDNPEETGFDLLGGFPKITGSSQLFTKPRPLGH